MYSIGTRKVKDSISGNSAKNFFGILISRKLDQKYLDDARCTFLNILKIIFRNEKDGYLNVQNQRKGNISNLVIVRLNLSVNVQTVYR